MLDCIKANLTLPGGYTYNFTQTNLTMRQFECKASTMDDMLLILTNGWASEYFNLTLTYDSKAYIVTY